MISTIIGIIMTTCVLLAYGVFCVFIINITRKLLLPGILTIRGREFWATMWTLILVSGMIFGIVWIFKLLLSTYQVDFNRIEGYASGKELLPKSDESVYICTGHLYHSRPSCPVIRSSSGMTTEAEAYDAKEYGYEPCDSCYMTDDKYYYKHKHP